MKHRVKVCTEKIERIGHALNCLTMYIEQAPVASPLLWIGDKKTPVTSLPDFQRAKDLMHDINHILRRAKAKA